ncbi:MAG: HIRAN domain-containing protein [Sterolibacterium sp.]|nr:HIRAN domain-containing protein [Sterolibacterium sp.]
MPVQVQAQAVRILVQSSPLAGFQHHAGAAFWHQLQVGDSLVLQREPDNSHDAMAVRVVWQGQQLGYLPRAQNRAVAVEMDRGARVEARIARLREHRNPWQRVLVEVWLVL